MKNVRVRAPGKAVVSGEYAVLDGAPAISMAVDRHAVVTITQVDDKCHTVTMPGLAEGEWRFTAGESAIIEWTDEPPGGGRLVEQVWQACKGNVLPSLSLSIDTSSFFDPESRQKLGFGSSAAATVALVTALSRFCPGVIGDDSRIRDAHRHLQGGYGSGVDIATSLAGGLIEYRMKQPGEPKHLSWPDQIAFRFLWSGKPSDTVTRVSRLDRNRVDEPSRKSLTVVAEQVAAVWGAGEATAILESLRAYTVALRRFSIDHDLGIFDAGHEELVELSAAAGLTYKPCGAGGGDIGIVMGTDPVALARFCDDAAGHGFLPLDVSLNPGGVEVSVEEQS